MQFQNPICSSNKTGGKTQNEKKHVSKNKKIDQCFNLVAQNHVSIWPFFLQPIQMRMFVDKGPSLSQTSIATLTVRR